METEKQSFGRPKKYDEVLYFGMRVSSQEREKIHKLAKTFHKPARDIIMELVNQALSTTNNSSEIKCPRRITTSELRAMPKDERKLILKEQAEYISKSYEIIDYNEDIIE